MAVDILLDSGGDILVNNAADITPKHSIRQDVKIRLQWFFEEWRFGPEFGLPYFEEVFVKNPSVNRITQIIREESSKTIGVTEIRDVRVNYSTDSRAAAITFTIVTDDGSFREELNINV